MKPILTLALLSIITIECLSKNSDSTSFNAGKIIFSLGYGYPSVDQSLYSERDLGFDMIFTKWGTGAFHFRGEYALSDRIGIGISINYDTYGGTLQAVHIINPNGSKEYYTYKHSVSAFTGLLRFNYHFATTKKLDPYFSVGAGFRGVKNTFMTDDLNGSFSYYKDYINTSTPNDTPLPTMGFEAIAGMRYYFNEHIGIYSEMGIAKSIIQIGISVGL
jgi:opacity protein-like surface antigen